MSALYPTALSASRVYAHFSASGLPQAGSVLSRDSVTVIGNDAAVNRTLSRDSVAVLNNDQVIYRALSRDSVVVLNNDQVINRMLSRTSIQVLVRTKPRFEGWGVGL